MISSHDVPEIPLESYERITAHGNITHAIEAMQAFIRKGDVSKFEYAVALYVASARNRQEPIEKVTGALCALAENLEGPKGEAEILAHPSRMHELIFNGILRAFYGVVAVERADGARAQRKADASQHVESGTWPRRAKD
jgi:hypothetical protein